MRALRVGAVLLATALSVGACGFPALTSLPLPGGASSGPTYQVTVLFADAATLVVRDAVRVNDVPVGEVTSIGLTPDLKAKVVCRLDTSVHLPRNAGARIASTGLLGEDFVAFAAPLSHSSSAPLSGGDTIVGGATTDPDVEQVLGALSAVLNGGSIGQLQVVVRELDAALKGRTGDVRSLLSRLKDLVGTLDVHKQTIVDALTGLDRLSAVLAQQHAKLGAILSQLPAGIDILAAERPSLTALVSSVARLGDAATHVITASSADLVADLGYLKPVLTQLSKRGTEIATSLNYALTFPFGKDALAAFKGDYAGFYASLSLNADDLSALLQSARAMAPAGALPAADTGAGAAAGQVHALPGIGPLRVIGLGSAPKTVGDLLIGVITP